MEDKSESNVVIRRAVLGDAATLSALNKKFNGVIIPASDIRSALRKKGTEAVFVAELEEHVVGFACVQITSSFCSERKKAELTDLFVAEPGRRKGIGSIMLLVIRKYIEEHNVSEIFLRVNRSNESAIAFYESHGLQDAGHSEFRIKYSQ